VVPGSKSGRFTALKKAPPLDGGRRLWIIAVVMRWPGQIFQANWRKRDQRTLAVGVFQDESVVAESDAP
jgi:hypothetical protein